MGVENKRTVWLLGAGFSQALGGPLLADLFRPREWREDELVFPTKEFPSLSWDLCFSRLFCEVGRKEGIWQDAEDFLATVDSAHRNGSDVWKERFRLMFERMSSNGSIPFGTFNAKDFAYAQSRFVTNPVAIRRALAAECSAFLWELDEQDERWHSYREWVKTLTPGSDTVISFNYDRVLEELAEKHASNLKVLLPSECPGEATPRPSNVVPVLKLHGSVDWQQNESKQIVRGNLKDMLASELTAPFMAAPGRSKQDAVVELGPLWGEAQRALKDADALEILGYGFPATDTKARAEIQLAFANQEVRRRRRRIDVVLGPNTNRPEAQRVIALLESFAGNQELKISPETALNRSLNQTGILYLKAHHLWAQDFIF